MHLGRSAAIAILISCCSIARGDLPPSPVRSLTYDGGACSAVVTSQHTALTAAHCVRSGMKIDGRPVVGFYKHADLADLIGVFRPPYAQIDFDDPTGKRVVLEGFGCDSYVAGGEYYPIRSIRDARVSYRWIWEGLELVIAGRVCKGDSGGAVWSPDGLVGIMTARDNKQKDLAYATKPW